MKITYKEINFRKETLDLILIMDEIIEDYKSEGLDLTVRQLYYQLVSRNIIKNTQKEYSRIASILNDARLSGYIDWLTMVDRTRYIRKLSCWDNINQILKDASSQYRLDKWKYQTDYIEVWVEKDALIGVIERVCNKYDVPFLSCRGYFSQSEMWRAAQRFANKDKYCRILHLGDHDPSGIDMTRDITDRLLMFEVDCYVNRIGLTHEQVEKYNLPPNPAKITDSRSGNYISKYGKNSWELDALDPKILEKIIENHILNYLDMSKFNIVLEEERQHKERLLSLLGSV